MPIATRNRLNRAKVVTSRELSLNTASVVDEVIARGRPAIITKHGRLIAALVGMAPLTEAQLLATPAAQAFMDTLDSGDDGDVVEVTDEGLCGEEPDSLDSTPAAAVSARLPKANVVTMRRLNQQTGVVLNEVRSRDVATMISKHGRLIGALVPVPEDIESQLLADTAAQALMRLLGSEKRDGVAYGSTPDEVMADLALEDND